MATYSIINLASTAGEKEVSKLGNEVIGAELEDREVSFDIVMVESIFVSNRKDLTNNIGIILIDANTDDEAFKFIVGKLEDSKCPTVYAAPYNKGANEEFDTFTRVGGDTTSLNVNEVIGELKTLDENSFDPKVLNGDRKDILVGNLVNIIRTIYGDGSPIETLFGRTKFIDERLYQFGVAKVEKNLDNISHFIDILNRKVGGRKGLEVEELEAVFTLTEVMETLIRNSDVMTERDLDLVSRSDRRFGLR